MQHISIGTMSGAASAAALPQGGRDDKAADGRTLCRLLVSTERVVSRQTNGATAHRARHLLPLYRFGILNSPIALAYNDCSNGINHF
jgi:hypothetical protein